MPKDQRRIFRYTGPTIPPRAGGLAGGVPTGTRVRLGIEASMTWLRGPTRTLVPVWLDGVPVEVLLPVKDLALDNEGE